MVIKKKTIMIVGNTRYIDKLASHLKKEHPSTRDKLSVYKKR